MEINRSELYLKKMNTEQATRGYGALSNEVRLNALKLLVRAGESGLPSGEIAKKLDVPHNSLSQQLALLAAAGLVRHKRDGRQVFYTVDLDAIKKLIKFLVVNCAHDQIEGVRIDS